MADEQIMETVYGKHHKYTVIKKSLTFSYEYWIRRDGQSHKGPYKTLSSAVEAAKEEA